MWRKWISQCSFGYWFDKLNQCRVDIARLIGFGVDSICWFHRWVVRCACPYLNNYIMRSFNSHTDTQDVWFRTRAKFRYVKLLYCEWMRVAQTCGAFYWASLIEWKEMQKQSKKTLGHHFVQIFSCRNKRTKKHTHCQLEGNYAITF